MLKKFVFGIIFGVGAALGMLGLFAAVLYFDVLEMVVERSLNNEVLYPVQDQGGLESPPSLDVEGTYLGSHGIFSGRFAHDQTQELNGGPGQIIGRVTAGDSPVVGLKLRLALNGKVYSRWATTDSTGSYEISVPFGAYRVDGYQLDHGSANALLAGKINSPQNISWSSNFTVSSEEFGNGPNLSFIDPVKLDIQKRQYLAGEEVVVHWEPYPDAVSYSIQVYEMPQVSLIADRRAMFPWRNRPVVKKPWIELNSRLDLKPGHYYRIDLDALGKKSEIISNSGNRWSEYDFEIVE
jgi:hypothetical protein